MANDCPKPNVAGNSSVDVTVIVVTWNSMGSITRCLEALDPLLSSGEIIVVDNASWDGTVDTIHKHFPAVRVVANRVNVGFGRGSNQGAAIARGRVLAFVNPDAIVSAATVKTCVGVLSGRKDLGALSCLTVKGPGLPEPPLIAPPSPLSDTPCLALLISWLRKMSLGEPQHRESVVEVTGTLSGAFLVLPTDVFRKIGGFDPNLFLYFEDDDLCTRIRKLGLGVGYYVGATYEHEGGRSTTAGFGWRAKYEILALSRQYYQRKWYGRYWVIGAIARIGRSLMRALVAGMVAFVPGMGVRFSRNWGYAVAELKAARLSASPFEPSRRLVRGMGSSGVEV